MYCCEGLRLNVFREVAIPANKEYFKRYGLVSNPAQPYSGDELVIRSKTKIDTFADMEQYDAMKAREESSKTD